MTDSEKRALVADWKEWDRALWWKWHRHSPAKRESTVREACRSWNRQVINETADLWGDNRLEAWATARAEQLDDAEANRRALAQRIQGGNDGDVCRQVAARMDQQMWARLSNDPNTTDTYCRLQAMARLAPRADAGFVTMDRLPSAASNDAKADIVAEMCNAWEESYSNEREALMLQLAASHQLADLRFADDEDELAAPTGTAKDALETFGYLYREFLDATHRNTQTVLAEAGIRGRIRLYRSQQTSWWDRGKTWWAPDRLPMRPLMSCTTNLNFARAFALNPWCQPPYEPDTMAWEGRRDTVDIIELLAPVEAIVSTAASGYGTQREHEVVVAAHDPWPAEVLRYTRNNQQPVSLCETVRWFDSSEVERSFPPPETVW